MRESKNSVFMKMAILTSKRSTCLAHQIGAIIVSDGHIVATGYNGPPASFPHCKTCKRAGAKSGDNLDNCFAIHAEANCIIQLAKTNAIISENLEMYCTDFPCSNCLKMIVNLGVKVLYYIKDYPNVIREDLLKFSSIEIAQLKQEGEFYV